MTLFRAAACRAVEMRRRERVRRAAAPTPVRRAAAAPVPAADTHLRRVRPAWERPHESGRWHPPSARFTFRPRSEEQTSELQSLMRTSYAVFCLKKTTHQPTK